MKTRIVALACAGLWMLAACTAPSGPAPVTTGSGSSATTSTPTPATRSGTPSSTPVGSASASSTRPNPSGPPSAIVLTGTGIGDLRLGRAAARQVDRVVEDRLGKPKVGQPQLCQSATDRAQMVVIDHTWPGFSVRYGSTGGPAVAVGWSVDLGNVPDGFALGDNLRWRTTFASLKREGAHFSREGAVQSAELTHERVTYSGPLGATEPDTLAGGPALSCD